MYRVHLPPTRELLVSRSGIVHIDRSDAKGAHFADRLEQERVAWMTTVAADGTPQTSPIWFHWDGEEFVIYSLESARVRNLATNPRVSLNLDGNGLGGDILVVAGTASIDRSYPSAARNEAFLAKYRPVMDDYGWTPEYFAGEYSVPIRVTPTKYRYW
jgi:PPOX class probable F420-dependent enzyme